MKPRQVRNVNEKFKVAVVGAGPAGLTAAAHAAEMGVSHLLLESSAQLSNTIFRYQKGKFVMAEPGSVPLRSPLPFEAGKREAVLDGWNDTVKQLGVNVRNGAEVMAIDGQKGDFQLHLKSGEVISAAHIVLAIGLQGNIRKLGTEGEDLPFVQYQLDDAGEYADETIVVVGAGDAAIENAVSLTDQNKVIIVNRKDEFARVKCTSSEHMGPLEPFSKRHFSARTFSSLAC